MTTASIATQYEDQLINRIRNNLKTRNDLAVLERLEAEEGASLEWFEFKSLLSIYHDLLTGQGAFAVRDADVDEYDEADVEPDHWGIDK